MKQRLTALASVLGLLANAPAWAQPDTGGDDDSRWYRVELLIFAQGGTGAASSERWDPEPELAYPERHRFLVYPEKVEQRIAAHPGGNSTISAQGQQVIDFPLPEDEAALDEADAPTDIPRRDTAAAVEASPEQPPAAEETPPEPLLPEPWQVRASAELEFRGKAAYMEQRGSYEVLFHQTWLQPMAPESSARSIIIDDSGSEARYPRLQGSVKLYLARYLHINTNLWLNTDGHYLPTEWRMPAPPLAPASLAVTEPVDLGAMSDAMMDSALVTEAEVETAPDADEAPAEAQAPVETEVPPYPYRHAIVLQQQRRMRSTEVHYLDHPMMGVVVKLTPLSRETLEEMAEAEAPEDPASP